MILYDNRSWTSAVFTWNGTVWPTIWRLFFCLVWYVVASYVVSMYLRVNFGSEGHSILGGTMSFLMIFRANQAYARYWEGRSFVSFLFSDIRDFVVLSLLYLRGGVSSSTWLFRVGGVDKRRFSLEDKFDEKVREARCDIIRLCVCLAITFKMHTRICYDGYCFGEISKDTKWKIDFDRFRLRQMMPETEWALVDEHIGIMEPDGFVLQAEDAIEHFTQQFKGDPDVPPAHWP